MTLSKKELNQIKQLLTDESYFEGVTDMAKLLFQKFQILKKAGFSQNEALNIVIRQGISWSTSE